MKNRKTCWRGCPTERENHFQCIAYKKNGRLCRKPAVTFDPARGGFICERHRRELVEGLTLEAGKGKLCPS